MSTAKKLKSWDGKNKSRTRLFKLYDITNFVDDVMYDEKLEMFRPNTLSLAGPKAVLEKMLVKHGLVKPEDIITVQTYEKISEIHHGKELLPNR